MPSHAVNKEYQEQLNRQKQEVCQEYTEVCPSFECMPFHYQAYCTEEGHCAVQIDCVISCDLMKMSGLDEAFARKYSQCECDMEEKAPTSVGDNCQVSSDCGAMDCSHLDNPVKTGYAPDCVRGSCKCMCYGCM